MHPRQHAPEVNILLNDQATRTLRHPERLSLVEPAGSSCRESSKAGSLLSNQGLALLNLDRSGDAVVQQQFRVSSVGVAADLASERRAQEELLHCGRIVGQRWVLLHEVGNGASDMRRSHAGALEDVDHIGSTDPRADDVFSGCVDVGTSSRVGER